jgi:hypothetical protein
MKGIGGIAVWLFSEVSLRAKYLISWGLITAPNCSYLTPGPAPEMPTHILGPA